MGEREKGLRGIKAEENNTLSVEVRGFLSVCVCGSGFSH